MLIVHSFGGNTISNVDCNGIPNVVIVVALLLISYLMTRYYIDQNLMNNNINHNFLYFL